MYSLLHNKSIPITDKVKVVRYACKFPCEDWPNKDQDVMDWLSTTLLNRKRISDEDCQSVWKCFHDVLHTTRCQHHMSISQQLVLKPAVYQMLITELSRLNTAAEHCDVIISCCYKLLTSPVFGHVWSSRLDNLLQVMIHGIRLCVEQLDKQLSTHLLPLLNNASHAYTAGCKKSGNARQVIQQTCQKLFIHVAIFQHVAKRYRGQLMEELNQTVQKVELALLTALYSSELAGSYELYLKLKTSVEKSESVPPKHISVLFTQVSSCLQSEETRDKEALLSILPLLFDGFVQQYIGTNQVMCFQFCQYLFELLHVVPSVPSGTTETCMLLETEDQLNAIEQLLKIMIKRDVYNMAADHISGDKQLVWFRSCSKWLYAVEVNKRSAVWFNIHRRLLELNYAIIEPNLKTFFDVTWLQISGLEEAKSSQAGLLCDLVSMYTQLRQLPKLFTRLTEILQQTDLKEKVYFPEQLDVCLLDNFLKQPLPVILSIWQSLIENVISNYLSDGCSREALGLLCHILSVLLSSIRVVEQGITHQIQSRIQDLMKQTAEDLLYHLVNQVLGGQHGDHTVNVLELIHSWGQLQLLMMKYFLCESGCSTGTVHYYLKTKLWHKLGQTLADRNCAKCTLFWIKLQHQSLRCKLCFDPPDAVAPSVVEFVHETLQHVKDGIKPNVTWNQQFSSVTVDNLHVAVWSVLADLLPVVSHLLKGHQMETLAGHIVNSLSESRTPDEAAGALSLASITKGLISDGCIWEIPQLTTAIIDCVWSKLSSELHEVPLVRSHKKRRLSYSYSLSELLQNIAQSDMNDSDEVMSLCETVNSVLMSPLPVRSSMEVATVEKITCLLQVMNEQPLLYLSCSNQLKHVLCLLVLLSSLKPTEQVESVWETGLQQLLLSYSSPQSRYVSQHISPIFLLKWLALKVHKQLANSIQTCLLQLYKVIYKQALCSVDCQQSLCDVTQKLLSHWNQSKDDIWMFNILVLMLDTTVKLLKKTYLAKETTDGVQSLQVMLVQWLESTVSQFWSSSHPELKATIIQMPAFKAQVLKGYSSVITTKKSITESDHALMHNMCNLCIELLQANANDSEVLDCCLTFIRTVCKIQQTQDASSVHEDNKQQNDSNTDSDDSGDKSDSDQMEMDMPEDDRQFRMAHSEYILVFITRSWECLLDLLKGFYSKAQDLNHVSRDVCLMEREIKKTFGYMVNAMSTKQFLHWLNLLLNNVCLDVGIRLPQEIILSLRVWTMLLESPSLSSHQKGLLTASQHLLFCIHHLVVELDINTTQYQPIVLAALTTEATLLATQKVSVQYISLVIETCSCVPLNDFSADQFVPIFTIIEKLIATILSHYPHCVTARMPIINLSIRHLLKALVWQGRQKSEAVNEHEVMKLAQCAQLMESLLNQLCMYKTECTKIAAYLVADYTASLHKVTLLPQVKVNLLLGIYHCLRACDEHAIALLHATLSPGLVEIFKSIYTEYNKYYKYTGKV